MARATKSVTVRKSKAAIPSSKVSVDLLPGVKLPAQKFVVRGQVHFADGTPLAGAPVSAFHKDLCSEKQLGKRTIADKDGYFEIGYTAGEFARAGKLGANLFVRVGKHNGSEPATSNIIYNAQPEETVPLVVQGGDRRGPSEYERLTAELAPALKGTQLHQLNEIKGGLAYASNFLAEESGQDHQHIAWLAQAEKLAHESESPTEGTTKAKGRAPASETGGIPAAAFYCWFCRGLEPGTLWATPADTLVSMLKEGIEQHVVPPSIGANLDGIGKRIERTKLDLVLKAPALGTTTSLGELLDTVPALNPDQQRAIAAVVTDLRPDDPELVKRIADVPGFDKHAAVGVARTLRLGALTGGHLPMAKALQARLAKESEGTLRPLAKLRPEQLLDLAYSHGTPDETIAPVAYADALAARVEQQHPTATLAAHLTDGRLLGQHPALTHVGKFLVDHPDFNIVTANLSALSQPAKAGGAKEPKLPVEGLRTLQRMNALGASWDETATLLEHDLYSPDQLLAAGPTQLTALLEGRLAPERVAALHSQAEELHNVTIAAYTAAFSPFSGPRILPANQLGFPTGTDTMNPSDVTYLSQPRVLALDPGRYKFPPAARSEIVPYNTPGVSAGTVSEHEPTLQALFGSQDACACGHCSSVLSPAAYFVDVLQFIKNANLDSRLLERRPDLQDVELSCNNSNTEVPAIDLALEILENAVALPLDVKLEADTKIEDQLKDGLAVGPAIEKALKETVRNLAGKAQAARGELHKDGTTDWTVVDGHRRWTLTALPENALKAMNEAGVPQTLGAAGVDLKALMTALDEKSIPKNAEETFAGLFAPNQKSEYANYEVTVTPTNAGHSWDVAYRFVAELLIDTSTNRLMLRHLGAGDNYWSKNDFSHEAIQALLSDLAEDTLPTLVRRLVAPQFSDTGNLAVKAVRSSERARVWTVTSKQRVLTLTFTPARLTITSLAYQSGDASADAIAEPENHNPAAYALLKGETAVFPWSLPVDLPLEEVRLFLERARSSRRRLIELMLPVDERPHVAGNDSVIFALEVLGLSEDEAKLIAPSSPPSDPKIYSYWGLSSDATSIFDAASGSNVTGKSPLILLKNVSILLQQSRLGFEELQAVLATQFVSADAAALRIEGQATCKPSEMKLPALTTAHLDRLHRFIRLWRKLGWTIRDLDQAIKTFGSEPTPDITSDTLIGLALLKRLKEQLKLPLTSLIGGLGSLETRPWTDYLTEGAPVRPSLYASLFQPEPVRSVPRVEHGVSDHDAFALGAEGKELADATRHVTDRADYVGAALGINSAVVADWVSGTNGLGIADELKLANLSRLAAAADLCSALSIDPETLSSHLKLYGTPASPFRPVMSAHERAAATLEFVERFRSVEKSGVDVETLLYLLQHETTPDSNLETDYAQLTQLADLARDAVRSILDAPEKTPPLAPDDPERIATAQATLLAREDAAIAALATGLGAARELVDELLRNRLRPSYVHLRGIDALLRPEFATTEVSHSPTAPVAPSTAVDPGLKTKVDAADKAVADMLVRLHKTVFICNALKLDPADLRLLRTGADDENGLSALDFNTLPIEASGTPASIDDFERLLAITRLRGIAKGARDLLYRYAFPTDPTAVWNVEEAQQVLMTGLTLTKNEVEAAAKQLRITTAEQYRDPIVLTRLIELLTALKQLGATVKQASELTAPSPSDAAALSARDLLQSKYGESQWHDLIKPISDKLRERQRNALVDYLINRDQLRDANDLYEHYLIDVQTGSCMKTTRLLQATAAVQLFVQRVMLNLENDVSLDEYKRGLWDWMHNYRVWEANRKVFLFPENWLLPELRDDKTSTFRQMEGVLTEKEPSLEITHAALLGYVEELGDLAQISVIAMYQDQSTLYVVGRTPDQPYRYFWRSCWKFGSAQMSWSGWEALDLDNANDFIMPFVFDGDLHTAWPIFRKTKKEDELLLWEVQIAWIRRTNQGWTKRKISQAQLNMRRLLNKDESASFAFRITKVDSPLVFANHSTALTRETIDIDCYAVDETIPTMRPDPSLLKDADPIGTRKTSSGRWNVSCVVSGVVYEYATVNEDGNVFSRPLKDAVVKVSYECQFTGGNFIDGDIKPQQLPSFTTDKSGTFNLSIPTTLLNDNNDRNGGEGVSNGSAITLTVTMPSALGSEEINLTRTLGNNVVGFFKDWKWHVNVGVENVRIKESFLPDRLLQYREAGSFVLESGKDVRGDDPTLAPLPDPKPRLAVRLPYLLPMSVDGNRFSTEKLPTFVDNIGLNTFIDNIDFGAEGSPPPITPVIEPPVFITRASQPSGPPEPTEPHAWYLQDNDGGYYLQKQEDGWHRWPDGQPYASSYRIAAAVSASALFEPKYEFETHLHFDPSGNTFARQIPYANYNWELFLHAPLAIADYLASQQRFADARLWLHAVFDPTTEKKDKTTNQIPQYWRFMPFDNAAQPDAIAKLLTWLAKPSALSAEARTKFEDDFGQQIDEWKNNPFMPHVIARLRPSAYQWYTLFAYLDVLIGWGDQLFRRDTRESVNDATLLYVLAAKLLGPRPRVIPAAVPPVALTYRLLRTNPNQLDDFSNAWVDYADLPGVKQLVSAQAGSSRSSGTYALRSSGQPSNHLSIPIPYKSSGTQTLTSLSGLAFCVPQNEKVTELYDRVEDRLFKVRHCQNIEGVFRELPLYDPPIDPLLLIRARAAGLSIYEAIAGLSAPLPNYRFSFTLQKALELCAEVKALGGALLTTLEKQDAEELTLLRSRHEIAMLKLVSDTRKQQIAEAEANIAALQQSEATILERFGQYQKLLGKPGITKGQDGLPVVEQSSSLTVSTDAVGGVSGLGLSRKEVDQLILTALANQFTQQANSMHVLAGVLSIIPNIWTGDAFVAGSTFGGSNLGSGASAIAKAIEMGATHASYLANQAGTFGGYERRQDEWVHQSKLALAEMKQIQKQILAAEIRKNIAERELSNHETQIENAQEVEDFMRGKFTNQQLFRWMSSKIGEIYFRTYQLALDQARRAERTYQHELGLDSKTTPFVQADHWDSLKRGLLAGEHLHHDLKRMESAYLERNVREFEITKHISLMQLDPRELVKLRETGQCSLSLPEEIFDLDFPGHYFRRIKSVSLTLPCVAGPYTTISCTLRLTKNSIRINTNDGDHGYPHNVGADGAPSADDSRFVENNIPVKAIAASNAQNDSGVFELSFRDERYLPFEGAGAVSKWALELFSDLPSNSPEPANPDFGKPLRQFDYKTISDAILHVKYTAREDAGQFKNNAIRHLRDYFKQAGTTPSLRMFSLRQEFPTQWQRFLNPANPANGNIFELEMSPSLFRTIDGGKTLKVNTIWLLARCTSAQDYSVKFINPHLPPAPPSPPSHPLDSDTMTLTKEGQYGGLHFSQRDVKDGSPSVAIVPTSPPVTWQLKMTPHAGNLLNAPAEVEDVLLVLGYEWA